MKNIKLATLVTQTINERPSHATEVLRELVDDYQMEMEILINEQYGQVDLEKFRKEWYDISSDFEKKFRNVMRNMMRR